MLANCNHRNARGSVPGMRIQRGFVVGLVALSIAVFAQTAFATNDVDVAIAPTIQTTPNPVVEGDQVQVTSFVGNFGQNPAEGVMATYMVSSVAVVVTGIAIQGSVSIPNANTIIYDIGTLNSGQTKPLSMILQTLADTAGQSITITGEVTTTSNDIFSDDNLIVGEIPIVSTPGGTYNPNKHVGTKDPIGSFARNFFMTEPADLHVRGPLDVFFQRSYDSAMFTDGVVKSTLGHNWQHNYEMALSATASNATVAFQRGRTIRYDRSGTNWVQISSTEIGFQLVDQGADRVLTDPRSQLMYTFNAEGQLVRIEDGRGNSNVLTYVSGQLANVTDGLGRNLSFSYNSSGLLTNVIDGIRSVSFGYGSSNLTSFVDAQGRLTTYAYDISNTNNPGLMTGKTWPEGNVPVTQVYDVDGKVANQTDAASNTTTLVEISALAAKTNLVIDPLGQTQVHVYRPTGELIRWTDEDGQSIFLGVDAAGRRRSIRDRNARFTTMLYDITNGLPTQINNSGIQPERYFYTPRFQNGVEVVDLTRTLHPDGTEDSFRYNMLGNLVSFTNRNGNVWNFSYNDHGQPLSVTNPVGGVASFTYDANARLVSAADTDVGITTYQYDELHRLTNIVHPNPDMIGFTWDALDRLTSTTDERGHTTAFQYDDNSRLTDIVNASAKRTKFEYDELNRLVRSIDRLDHTNSVTYDPRSQVATLTNRNGNVTRFQYDERRRLTHLIDPGGKINRFEYDSEGLLTAVINPLGERIGLTRDPMGYVTSLTDAQNNRVFFQRDQMKRVTQVTDPQGRIANFGYDVRGLLSSASRGADLVSADYGYDALGNLTLITDPNGRPWTFAYTPMGRVKTLHDPLLRTATNEFDVRGRLAKIKYPDGVTLSNSYDATSNPVRLLYSSGPDLHYAYDSLNRLTNATGSTAFVFTYDAMDRIINTRQGGVDFGAAYDGDGRLTNVTYNSGQFRVSYTYDTRDRLIQVSDNLSGTVMTFIYDDADRLIGMTRPNGVNGTYTYDVRGLLTRIQEGNVLDLRYAFDPSGQVTEADFVTVPIDPTTVVSNQTFGFNYDFASQISSAGYLYDQRGRLTNAPNTSLAWDGASRLVGIDSVSLGYNALGDVVTRAEGGVTNRYYYNHAVGLTPIVSERNDNTGQFTRHYVWSPGGLLLYIINLPGNTVSFPIFDRVGSTLALTGAAGVVTDAYAYNAYGRLLAQTGLSTQPFRFNGRFGVRSDSSLYHMRARWYDPLSSRFLTRDPFWPVLTDAKEANPYQFALLDPISFIDPTGQYAIHELMIQHSIAHILISLILPAVQKVREAAVRMEIANNLKQLGIAFNNYHSTYTRFPPTVRGVGGNPAQSWTTLILPYMEQDNLYRWNSISKIQTVGSNFDINNVRGNTAERVINGERIGGGTTFMFDEFRNPLPISGRSNERFHSDLFRSGIIDIGSQTRVPQQQGGKSLTTGASFNYSKMYGGLANQMFNFASIPTTSFPNLNGDFNGDFDFAGSDFNELNTYPKIGFGSFSSGDAFDDDFFYSPTYWLINGSDYPQ